MASVHLLGSLLIDAVLGWVASRVMQNGQQDAATNIALGFAGAAIAGWLLAWATSHESDFTLAGIFVSFLGAIALLGVVNLIRGVHAR
jgi:uncharacterized membrane protein YeaQ/YmgE (transglycosylase-associated protein family)